MSDIRITLCPTGTVRELAHRCSRDLDVWLLWSATDNRVWVELADHTAAKRFRIIVADRPPLEVFNHPFASARVEEVTATLAAA